MALTKVTGSVIKDSVSLSGNVSVGGTLTYQDVTNVDALGIGTFRTGIKVLAGQVDVGSNIKLGNAGVVTATSFVGSGANLTGIDASSISFGGAVKAQANAAGVVITGIATVQSNLHLPDASKLMMGDNNEFRIYHNESNSLNYIVAQNNGPLLLRSSNADMIHCTPQGAVTLKYDGGTRAATTSSGFDVSGTLNIAGVATFSQGGSEVVRINSGGLLLYNDLSFFGASTHAYWDHSANQFKLNDNTKLSVGSSSDLQIFHDGSDSLIKDTGTGALKVCSNLFRVNNAANTEAMIKAEENAGVTLSYDANTKFETTSSGVTVTGTCSATAFNSSGGTLTGVAFAAVRTAGNSNNTPFVFNSEEFDIGSDYNSSNGIFTAPDIGYYQITVQMTSTTYSGNRSFSLESSTNGGGSWTQRANALTGTPGGANESINMFIGGVFKTTVTNQQFRVKVDNQFRGTETYSRFSAFKL